MKTGRPKVEIDNEQLEKLCALGCTEIEIASFFHCCIDTINEYCKRNYQNENGESLTFQEVSKLNRNIGKISKRAKLSKMADESPLIMRYYADNVLKMDEEKNTRTEKLKAEIEYTKTKTAQLSGESRQIEDLSEIEKIFNGTYKND
jgi:hypothetical protein